ncbi:2-C-methyl-D-erythritol 2,4-cyclodiphosphate synthase domain-containing protein [Toxoplasma gondii RUB]|uniref:2-C-methyl-D-erythritol 2,4-cyclodiphosphate synthase n=1 Tax=Toxoplasma gondii RUB TaxID=935652 RepID=A0A086LLS8_TOXGO|nr:2-C-methyl-D-erythritol 2,4-cyclodiphosphate synthase domain-containing protein [Toxoplasma gondii RUB]
MSQASVSRRVFPRMSFRPLNAFVSSLLSLIVLFVLCSPPPLRLCNSSPFHSWPLAGPSSSSAWLLVVNASTLQKKNSRRVSSADTSGALLTSSLSSCLFLSPSQFSPGRRPSLFCSPSVSLSRPHRSPSSSPSLSLLKSQRRFFPSLAPTAFLPSLPLRLSPRSPSPLSRSSSPFRSASLSPSSPALFPSPPRSSLLRSSSVGGESEGEGGGETETTGEAGERRPTFRIGHGYDLHRVTANPLEATGPLVIGGVCISTPPEKGWVFDRWLSSQGVLALRSFVQRFTTLLTRAKCSLAPWCTNAPHSAATGSCGESGRTQHRGNAWLSRLFRPTRNSPRASVPFSSSLSSSLSSSSPPAVENSFGVVAHSDGDVLLHAVCDAVFGAFALGDIGEHFSDSNPAFRGMSSSLLVARALEIVRAKHPDWRLGSVDATVVFDAMKFGRARKQKMRENLAELLQLPAAAVSVKAKTSEGVGPVGRKEAVACHVVLTLFKSTRTDETEKKQETNNAQRLLQNSPQTQA